MKIRMDQYRVELCEKEAELKQFRTEEPSDESKILNLIEAIGAARTTMAKEQLQAEIKLKTVLVTQQWRALQENYPKPPHQRSRPLKKGEE